MTGVTVSDWSWARVLWCDWSDWIRPGVGHSCNTDVPQWGSEAHAALLPSGEQPPRLFLHPHLLVASHHPQLCKGMGLWMWPLVVTHIDPLKQHLITRVPLPHLHQPSHCSHLHVVVSHQMCPQQLTYPLASIHAVPHQLTTSMLPIWGTLAAVIQPHTPSTALNSHRNAAGSIKVEVMMMHLNRRKGEPITGMSLFWPLQSD